MNQFRSRVGALPGSCQDPWHEIRGGWGGWVGIGTIYPLYGVYLIYLLISQQAHTLTCQKWRDGKLKTKQKQKQQKKEIIEIYVQLVIFYIYLWRRLGFYCWERKLPFVLFQLLLINSMCLRWLSICEFFNNLEDLAISNRTADSCNSAHLISSLLFFLFTVLRELTPWPLPPPPPPPLSSFLCCVPPSLRRNSSQDSSKGILCVVSRRIVSGRAFKIHLGLDSLRFFYELVSFVLLYYLRCCRFGRGAAARFSFSVSRSF